MSSYDQGRMDAWERIDAIKRRLGLAGFFNEQKIKRYPKGHPKAGQFMDLPDNPIKAKVPKERKFVVDINQEKSTEINGHEFSLRIGGLADTSIALPQMDFPIVFLANGETTMRDDIDPATKKKAAFWWRRQALDLPKKLPEGTIVSCSVEDRDEKGGYRSRFYEALGFESDEGDQMYSIVKNGKLNPISKAEAEKRPRRFLVSKGDLPYVSLKDLGEKVKNKKVQAKEEIDFRKWKITQLARKAKESGQKIAPYMIEPQQELLKEAQKSLRKINEKMTANKLNSERVKLRSKFREKQALDRPVKRVEIDMTGIENYFRRRNGG